MNIGEERFKTLDTVEVQKRVVFTPAVPLQVLEHCWFEVIIDDHARDPTPEFKRMTLAEHKGFLLAAIVLALAPRPGERRAISMQARAVTDEDLVESSG